MTDDDERGILPDEVRARLSVQRDDLRALSDALHAEARDYLALGVTLDDRAVEYLIQLRGYVDVAVASLEHALRYLEPHGKREP